VGIPSTPQHQTGRGCCHTGQVPNDTDQVPLCKRRSQCRPRAITIAAEKSGSDASRCHSHGHQHPSPKASTAQAPRPVHPKKPTEFPGSRPTNSAPFKVTTRTAAAHALRGLGAAATPAELGPGSYNPSPVNPRKSSNIRAFQLQPPRPATARCLPTPVGPGSYDFSNHTPFVHTSTAGDDFTLAILGVGLFLELALMVRAFSCLGLYLYRSFPRRVRLSLPLSVPCFGLELSLVTHTYTAGAEFTLAFLGLGCF
jgi:hypothetical protein